MENMTEAQKIWEDIKNIELNLYALPNQTPFKYCNVVSVEPTKLYLSSTMPAILPALELVLGKKYNVELVDRFIVIYSK